LDGCLLSCTSSEKQFCANKGVSTRDFHSFITLALLITVSPMARLSLFVLFLCAASVSASPRNLVSRNQERYASLGEGSGPPEYSHGDSWESKTDGWGAPSQYGGSWGHSSTADHQGSHYGGTSGDGWGHSSTCSVSTVVETSTVLGAASTVYISGSGETETLPASTIYISGSDHTSYLPGSTLTVEGPVETSISTVFGPTLKPAAPTTVFITRNGPGWNRTITQEVIDVTTTTQREVSTIYNEETATVTSFVTRPGKI
jgi:hypothetical protein